MTEIAQAPMTWMDVARRLAKASVENSNIPADMQKARVGWYGLSLERSSSGNEQEVYNWLEQLFPTRLRFDPLRLELEGPPHGSELPIDISTVDEVAAFRQSFGIVDGVIEFGKPVAKLASSRPRPVVAALSVKGGTGRTTSAIAFALRWAAKAGRPVLLVDADLEAPGISYLFREYAGIPKIALEDIVTLAHAENDANASETIGFAADRLKDHSMPGNLIVLPLRRDIDELASSAIRPEHLATHDRPFALADLLSELSRQLGCAGVVIDVRAGLVPIGVNLALDPNVSPIVVSTLSAQSIRATGSFIKFLYREVRRAGGEPSKPLLVVNRVPAIFRQTSMDKKIIEPLLDELLDSMVPDSAPTVSASQGLFDVVPDIDPVPLVEVPELPDIQVAVGAWDSYVEQIMASGFISAVAPVVDHFISTELSADGESEASNQAELNTGTLTTESREKLAGFADRLIAAENASGAVPKPLVTKPLAALTERFQSEVPIAICEGAKGTGKTLAARYFVSQRMWQNAVRELVGKEGAVMASLIPACGSIQSSAAFQGEIDEARKGVSEALGFGEPMSVYETTEWLKEQFSEAHGERQWVRLWLNAIAWGCGFEVKEPNAGDRFFDVLRKKGKSVVALFEGLEELYGASNDPGVEASMRALLISLPQRLRSEARRPIGAVIFARRDTVEAAIKQNPDQFRREYSPFALTWTDNDVLELAAWLADQSGAIPGLWNSSFSSLSTDERAEKLNRLWGKKLGPDDLPEKRTREAYTATWVIAVLSDLVGRLVPRDLVRLLATAAKIDPDQEDLSTYGNRLLVPRALRGAVEATSTAKVKETEEEIAELKAIFTKFRRQPDELLVPLTKEALEQIQITDAEIRILIKHGIVFGENAPYEVPELYRRGLELRHAGARRSVVNLYRRARQK